MSESQYSLLIASFAKECGRWHFLKHNDEQLSIKTSPALFVVRKGTLMLRRKGAIYKIVDQGSSYGVDNLMQNRTNSIYDAFAKCDNTAILELQYSQVR